MGDEDLRLQSGEPAWYQLPAEEAARRLRTDLHAGLSEDEVRERRERYGANEIREGVRRGPLAMFLGQFTDFMILGLIGAGIVWGMRGEGGGGLGGGGGGVGAARPGGVRVIFHGGTARRR